MRGVTLCSAQGVTLRKQWADLADVSDATMEVREDPWTMSDEFIYRHRDVAREPLQLPKELSLTTPSKYLQVVRQTITNLEETFSGTWLDTEFSQTVGADPRDAASSTKHPSEGFHEYMTDGSEIKSLQDHCRFYQKCSRRCPTVLKGKRRIIGRVIMQNTSCTSEEENSTCLFRAKKKTFTPLVSTPENFSSPLEPAVPCVSAFRPPRHRHRKVQCQKKER